MAAVKQVKKIVPFITCEVTLCQYVCELFFWCQCVWFGFFRVQINSIEQPIKSNSVGFWKHVSLLVTASLSSKMYSIARIEKSSRSTKHNQHHTIQECRVGLGTLVWFWVCFFDVVLRNELLRVWSLVLLDWFGEEWNASKTGFGIRNLNRFVTQWGRRSPRWFFVINRGQTTDFCLILD